MSTARDFPAAARRAISDATLTKALGKARAKFVDHRAAAVDALPEFAALTREGRAIRDHTLAHLDRYLERFAVQVEAAGGQVHWARDAEEARSIIRQLCRDAGAKSVTKGKSMASEEVGLNAALEADGLKVVETDLGEYIIQLRREPPSHIIAPAVHVTRAQVEDSFRKTHTGLDPARDLTRPESLLAEAREILRREYFVADVGITGANFLVAETGTAVIVTNEGNGDLTRLLPKTHIVLAGIEKITPTLADMATMLRLLARSATGQEMSVYTTLMTGPKRDADSDGPRAFHVVLLDNGRTRLLAGEFKEVLRCIRCGACMNHCPIYHAIGGHAYGSVYMGPIGAVLTPALAGLAEARHLPEASTLCGRCEEVCPVGVPLPKMLRAWREHSFAERLTPPRQRLALMLWGALAQRPRLYRFVTHIVATALALLGGKRGRFSFLPFAGGWTASRDFPAPEPRS